MTVNNRIEMVDALRGYALLGLSLVHCVERFELYWLDPVPGPWFDGIMAIFAGKAFAIFALLFGFSFATIMANERARGGDFALRFAWRLMQLFDVSHAEAVLWGAGAFALQIAGAALWFRHIRYGPLEWLWRAGTRTSLAVPFRQ